MAQPGRKDTHKKAPVADRKTVDTPTTSVVAASASAPITLKKIQPASHSHSHSHSHHTEHSHPWVSKMTVGTVLCGTHSRDPQRRNKRRHSSNICSTPSSHRCTVLTTSIGFFLRPGRVAVAVTVTVAVVADHMIQGDRHPTKSTNRAHPSIQ